MIVTWMLYCSLCALGLMLAGMLAERLLLAGRAPVRVVWIGALFLSIGLPIVALRLSSSPPAVVTIAPPSVDASVASFDATVSQTAADIPSAVATPTLSWQARVSDTMHELNTPLLIVWAALSAALAISLAGGVIALAWMRRRWEERIVQGVTVSVSRRTGPAVVGALSPMIVIPEWALSLPPSQLSLMLRHELEHLRARDGQLLIAAQIALIAMPWNVALWWQVLRLRVAIEMDCDARVLRVADPRSYGELLLEVARPHRSFKLAGMIAFAERASQLERRIRFLKRHRVATSKRATIAASTVTLLALSVAWVAPHPTAPARADVVRLPSVSSLPIVAMYDATTTTPPTTTPITVPAIHAARFTPARTQECASDTSVVGSTFRFVYDGVKLTRDNESKACELLARLVDEQLAEDAVAQASAMDLRARRAAMQSQRNTALGALLRTDADRAAFAANMTRMTNGTAGQVSVGRGRVSGGATATPVFMPPGGGAAGAGRVGRATFTADSVILDPASPEFIELQNRLRNMNADLAARGERTNMKMITTNDGNVVNTTTQVSIDTLAVVDRVRAADDKAKVEALLAKTAGLMTYESLFKGIDLSPEESGVARKIIDDAQVQVQNAGDFRVPATRLRVNHARGFALIVTGADTTLVDLAPNAADRAAVRARLIAVPQQ
ncbi:MAG TPA: M56 family metallopeptidase [Gemmatimonadaceae bacterium]|jgi:beta-lactamase regulating signal transducer with metallopeptidase domain